MKKYLLLILIVIINVSSIYAQEYYNLYKDYFPKGHEKAISADMINLQIKTDGELDPAIIYYRIIYIGNIVKNKTTDRDTSGYNDLRRKTYEITNKKDKWIESNISELETKHKANIGYNLALSHLKNNLTDVEYREVITTSFTEYNENLDYFFRYLFYTRDNTQKYSEYINYKNLVEKSQKLIINEVTTKLNNIKNLSEDELMSIMNTITKYWYVFEENKFQQSTIAQIFLAYYDRVNSIHNENQFYFHAGVNYYLYGNENKLSYKDFEKISSIGSSSINYDIAKLKSLSNENLFLGYKVFLREGKTYFSYLKSELLFTYAKLNHTNYDTLPRREFYYFPMYDDDDNFQLDTYTIYNPKFTFGEKYGFMVRLTTPLFYLNKDIVFEVGLIGGYERTKYSYSMTYDYTTYLVHYPSSNYKVIKKGEKIEETKYFNSYYASFVFNLCFTLFNNIYTEMFIHYNSVGLSAGISF